MAQGKGNAIKRDFIPAGQSKKPSEVDTLSNTDMGFDFVKPGETVTVAQSHGHKKINND
jgi:hypothetical protein